MSRWQGEWWRNPEFQSCSKHIVEWYLAKNLAGSPRKISGDEFIEWAEASRSPDEEARYYLRKAVWDFRILIFAGCWTMGEPNPRRLCA